MKTWIMSFGVLNAVAIANANGCIVGMVLNAPLLRLYGRGHQRINVSVPSPSCFRVKASALNRLSSPTSPCTYFERTVRQAMNETNDPMVAAEDAIIQPFQNPNTKPHVVINVL